MMALVHEVLRIVDSRFDADSSAVRVYITVDNVSPIMCDLCGSVSKSTWWQSDVN